MGFLVCSVCSGFFSKHQTLKRDLSTHQGISSSHTDDLHKVAATAKLGGRIKSEWINIRCASSQQMLKTSSISILLISMKQLLFSFFFAFFFKCSESHYFTSSISEQVTPFPVSPSGQGPHWNPSAVSMHLTPLKQELTSHLGLLRLGSWVGKFTVPKPLMQKEQQFQRLKETSITAFSWQVFWRDSQDAAQQGLRLSALCG